MGTCLIPGVGLKRRMKSTARDRSVMGGLPYLPPGTLIKNDKYKVTKKLWDGDFGAVYLVENAQKGEKYAMKVEGIRETIHNLKMENEALWALAASKAKHCCAIIDIGRNIDFSYIIMTLVGKNLEDLRKEGVGQHLSLSSALRAGRQCLDAIVEVHSAGFLHRDIKAAHFAVGRQEVNQHRNVFILDFSLVRKFLLDSGEPRTPRAGAEFRGTVRYAPISSHRGKDLGRNDDLETWLYMLVELTVGKLPWSTTQDMDAVGLLKETNRRDGSLFMGCPAQYAKMLRYIDGLSYWDKPDYECLYKLIRGAIGKAGISEADPYDWEKKK